MAFALVPVAVIMVPFATYFCAPVLVVIVLLANCHEGTFKGRWHCWCALGPVTPCQGLLLKDCGPGKIGGRDERVEGFALCDYETWP
jgi:hypothetical protein